MICATSACSFGENASCEDNIETRQDAIDFAYKYYGEGHESMEAFVDSGFELIEFYNNPSSKKIGFNYLNLREKTRRHNQLVYVLLDVSRCGKPKLLGRTEGM